MLFRTTLDIDFSSKWNRFKPKDKQFIESVKSKILFICKSCVFITENPSSFKGVHLELFCKIKCDICRFCYDDERRFAYDNNRPEWATNVLFDKKEKVKIC